IYKTKKIYVPVKEEVSAEEGIQESKDIIKCRKCKRVISKTDRCLCRPWLCHHCCECGQDCDLCGCNHKK
ncbi:MAG: hypothetical protein NTV36_02045, partial [Candidatus Staskawiczbacteria bacterium]|nr:hypothetical protein [Candidatus Staskawiczbacteria bacterium]